MPPTYAPARRAPGRLQARSRPSAPLAATLALTLAQTPSCGGREDAAPPTAPERAGAGGPLPGQVPAGAPGAGPGGPPPAVAGFHATPTFELVGEPAGAPRNVLIVSMDTVRADRLGVYGGRAETPVLSAFAARGVRFDQAVTHFPETCLSHWSMLTGVLPEVHGNSPAHRGSLYPGPTVAEIAARHGYDTAAFIGGVTLVDSACGLARGFSTYDDAVPHTGDDMKRPAAQVTAAATAWMQARPGPWLAFVHYFDAHSPYTPAPPWDRRYDPGYEGPLDGSMASLRPYMVEHGGEGRTPAPAELAHALARYDGELSELDGHLAPLLAAAGEDTVVLITSDHGESFEDGYWFNHRASLGEGVLRVPLLLAAPGLPPGAVVTRQVGLTDLAPTVLALAGLPVDARMQGTSLVPAIHDPAVAPHALSFSITDPWMPDPQFVARTEAARLHARGGQAQVWELLADPGAQRLMSSTPPELVGARARYDAAVATLAAQRVAAPTGPGLSVEERQRLEALGYMAPGPAGPR